MLNRADTTTLTRIVRLASAITALPALIVALVILGFYGVQGYKYSKAKRTDVAVTHCVDERSDHTVCYGTWQLQGKKITGKVEGAGWVDEHQTISAKATDDGLAYAESPVSPFGIAVTLIILFGTITISAKHIFGRRKQEPESPESIIADLNAAERQNVAVTSEAESTSPHVSYRYQIPAQYPAHTSIYPVPPPQPAYTYQYPYAQPQRKPKYGATITLGILAVVCGSIALIVGIASASARLSADDVISARISDCAKTSDGDYICVAHWKKHGKERSEPVNVSFDEEGETIDLYVEDGNLKEPNDGLLCAICLLIPALIMGGVAYVLYRHNKKLSTPPSQPAIYDQYQT